MDSAEREELFNADDKENEEKQHLALYLGDAEHPPSYYDENGIARSLYEIPEEEDPYRDSPLTPHA